MRERPIADLVDGLRQLGCDVTCGENGCPPVKINAAPGANGGTAAISGQTSSQVFELAYRHAARARPSSPRP
jgi:3-phosphoshikimate 1-carboxyvinyltransferase